MASKAWKLWLRGSLDRLQQRDLLRSLRPLVPTAGPGASPVKVELLLQYPRTLLY